MTEKGSIYPQLNNREWLYWKYFVERLTLPEIAKIIGCGKNTVDYHISRHNLPKRSRIRRKEHNQKISKSNITTKRNQSMFPLLYDKKWLIKKYHKENLTGKEIGAIVGCCADNVTHALRNLGIPRKPAKIYKPENNPMKRLDVRKQSQTHHQLWDKEWMEQKYINEELSATDIAAIVGCHKSSIPWALHSLGIPVRSVVEAKSTPRAIRKTIKSLNLKPNKLEKYVDDVLHVHFPNEWKYNGDYSCGVSLVGLIPDFVNVNGQKAVIEVYGDIYHDEKELYRVYGEKLSWKRTEFGRKAIFAQLGYKTVILWGSKIKEEGESYILEEIRRAI